MSHEIPSAAEVRKRLCGIELAEVRALAVSSGVPFTTLWKLRSGETENPGIETVRKFYALIPPLQAAPVNAPVERRVSTEPNPFPDLDRRAAVQGAT
jgi:hypothetical protein